MKTIRWMISLISLVGILCGCSSLTGRKQVPYLEKEELAEIEHGVLDGMEFRTEYTGVRVSFQNDSNYTLWDVDFISAETQTAIFTVSQLEPQKSCDLIIYAQELTQADSNTKIYMKYTIGEYTYRSELMLPVNVIDSPISEEAQEYQITVITRDGMVELEEEVPEEFLIGTEISGLKEFRIYSITAEIPYEGSIDFNLTGSESKDYRINLTAKLRNEDDIIVSSSRVYLFDGKGTIYCHDIDPGNYTLTFEETI